MNPPSRVTNNDLMLLLGEIKKTTENLDKAINGNGKPGLIDDHRCLEAKVEEHLKEAKTEKETKKTAAEKREKLSGRMWALILLVAGAFISNTVGLVFLFIRTGAIK